MVDLRQFVSQALTEIAEGIRAAQVGAKQTGVRINPRNVMGGPPRLMVVGMGTVEVVEFDVAITAIDGTGTQGKIAVLNVLSLNSGDKEETTVASRVRFRVQVAWPIDQDSEPEPPSGLSGGSLGKLVPDQF